MSEELIAASVRLAVPILIAALGEIVVERAGVINIGLEGMMLAGCLSAALVALATGSPWAALAAAVLAGLALALLFAIFAVFAAADPVVSGTGINLLSLGLTGFIYQSQFGRTGEVLAAASFSPWPVPLLSELPLLGKALFHQPAPAYIAYGLVLVVALMLGRTGLGLRLRAAGEEPRAAEAAGASVVGLRTLAVLVGGALAGAGGGALVLGHAGTFVEGMTAGRGFIALALVICARWRPAAALIASLGFGLLLALQFELQALSLDVPYQLVRMVPYLATMVVLIVTSGRSATAVRWGH